MTVIRDAVARLRDHGVRLLRREWVRDPLRGTVYRARLGRLDLDLAVFLLGAAADEGFRVVLAPQPEQTWVMEAWATGAGDVRSGLLFVDLDRLQLAGRFLPGDSSRTLAEKVGIDPEQSVVDPRAIEQALQVVGYRTSFERIDAGTLIVAVHPGRYIRRVRVRGEVPLGERKVRRALSLSARPGALVRGVCVHPRQLRKRPLPPVCADDDPACAAWEQEELDRLKRFLFDEGFLQAKVQLGFACGRAEDEADLWVLLDLGRPYRLRARDVRVEGNLGPRDARWVARRFQPTVSPFLPIPRRVRRADIERAVETVARELAAPQTRRIGTGGAGRRTLRYPYPTARVRTNYQALSYRAPPKKPPPLVVDVQLGRAVAVDFLGNDAVSESRLLDQMQLFQRREPPTPAAVLREAEHLRLFYQERGHPLAELDGSMPDFGGQGPTRILFTVHEGPTARIRSITTHFPNSFPKAVERRVRRSFQRIRGMRRAGRWSDSRAAEDLTELVKLLQQEGYICARAHVEVGFWKGALEGDGPRAVFERTDVGATPGRPGWIARGIGPEGLARLRRLERIGLYVRYVVSPGPRVLTSPRETLYYAAEPIPPSRQVEGLPLAERGRWGLPRMMRGSPLRRRGDDRVGGVPLRPGLARRTAEHIRRRYRRSGFPVADAEVRFVARDASGGYVRAARLDRLARQSAICTAEEAATLVDTEVTVYEGRQGRFGTTILRGNFKTRPYVLRGETAWKEGQPYDVARVERTGRNIDATGVADGVEIQARPTGCDLDAPSRAGCRVHHVITIREAKDVFLRPAFGVGLATLDPLYVFLRPTFPNILGTAWDISLEGHWGFNVFRSLCSNIGCYERSAQAQVIRRRWFTSPLTFATTARLQQRLTPARGRITSVLSDTQIRWPVGPHWQFYGGYLFQIANISKDLIRPIYGQDTGCGPSGTSPCRTIDRQQAVVPDHTGAVQTGIRFQKIDNPFNPHDGVMASLDAMFASTWLGGWDTWLKFDVSFQHFVPLPRTDDRLNFRYSLRYGHAIPLPSASGGRTTSIPEVWRYFAGGTQELGLRGIAPQTMLLDVEEVPDAFGFVRLRPRAVGGHIRLLGTLALQVTSIRDLFGGTLAHALFLDFGVLTQRWEQVQFLRDFRSSVGLNFLKFDVRLVTLALGYAVLVPNWIWPGNVRSVDDPNGRFVFDVGVTF